MPKCIRIELGVLGVQGAAAKIRAGAAGAAVSAGAPGYPCLPQMGHAARLQARLWLGTSVAHRRNRLQSPGHREEGALMGVVTHVVVAPLSVYA